MYFSPSFRIFLPEGWEPGKRELNRDYLYTLMYNIDKVFYKRVIDEALEIRARSVLASRKNREGISITRPQMDSLFSAPDLSTQSKCRTACRVARLTLS